MIGIAAHAKEGLIKRHSAQQAVRPIMSQLSSARGPGENALSAGSGY